MLCLTLAFLGTGAAVTKLNILRGLNWIWRDYVIAVAFFTVFYLIMFCAGLCVLGKRCRRNNLAICVYAFFMFFIGFIAMAGQGGALAAMEAVDIVELEKICQADPEDMQEIRETQPLGWLLVPLARMANRFDDYSESMLNGVMCTETCPCYRSEGSPVDLTGKRNPSK